MTKITNNFISFQGDKDKVMRNLIALSTMTQEMYDQFCDHELTLEERKQLDEMVTKGLLIKKEESYYLSEFAENSFSVILNRIF